MSWTAKIEEGLILLREIRDAIKELVEEHRASRL